MSIRQKKLPITALERIDDLCSDFERKWQAGERPPIESCLPEDIPANQRDVLLMELVALDVDYRRRDGETPSSQDYRDRFPQDGSAIEAAFGEGHKANAAFEAPSVGRLAQLFPELEIIELIGVGGMGAVYKARQTGLDRLVAIKILPEEFGHDVKFALRFTREARTLAKLSHPNIVPVFEFGHIKDTYYFLMEFVDGTNLREVIRAGQLAPPQALSIVPHLCDALQYAHDKGIVHRDIKPENILIAVDGSVKITDFGLSRILGSDSPSQLLTGTHQVLGTPRYMAPEQLEGSHRVDHRADIYSLGVVFYEMLTGELPMGRFAAPSQKVKIDVRLDEVVLRTLEKEPQRRYQVASQIKSDVQSITSTTQTGLEPTLVRQTHGHPRDRNTNVTSREQQELAGRLLLTRRQLLDRVAAALRPLFRWQLLQVVFGVAMIALGAQCWAQNTHVAHRWVNGLIVHGYGVLVVAQAIWVCTRIHRIDYSQPVEVIGRRLESLRAGYLRAGVIIGFAWWLMWIPVAVSAGFDAVVLQKNSLIPSLVIGIVGFSVSIGLYWRALRPANASAESWKNQLAGSSIAAASVALDEIKNAQIH